MMFDHETPMTVTRTDEETGQVIELAINGTDLTDGMLTFDVAADVIEGDIVSYRLPNGRDRVMRIDSIDVLQSPFGDPELDHTEAKYTVITTRPRVAQPARSVEIGRLHPLISAASGATYAQGHWSEAVFNAFRAVEARVQDLTGRDDSGKNLMTTVFNEQRPVLNIASTDATGRQITDQAEGYKFLFMGAGLALRNPHGHGAPLALSEDEALESLAFASLLMRALDRAAART